MTDKTHHRADKQEENISPDVLRAALRRYPVSPPGPFFDMINDAMAGAMMYAVIMAAVEMKLFDTLQHPQNQDAVCTDKKKNEMMWIICEILTSHGILIQNKDGSYSNSKMASVYLQSTSPYFQSAYLEKQRAFLLDLWMPLSQRVLSGPKQYTREYFFETMSLPSMAQNALCGRLQAVMSHIVNLSEFSSCKSALDIGGGHGLYAIALAEHNPTLTCVVQDLPGVIGFTKDYIKTFGMTDRVTTLAGDFMTDSIGSGYDIILSSSNPSGRIPKMVIKIADALHSGGYFITIQSRGERKDSLFYQLEWLLWTFEGVTEDKREWKKDAHFPDEEYLTALLQNGFRIIELIEIPDPYKKDNTVVMLITQKK